MRPDAPSRVDAPGLVAARSRDHAVTMGYFIPKKAAELRRLVRCECRLVTQSGYTSTIRSVRAVADGIPGNVEEASANVHAHSVTAVEEFPEIGSDIDPVCAGGGSHGACMAARIDGK
jgi:hypothetical protein